MKDTNLNAQMNLKKTKQLYIKPKQLDKNFKIIKGKENNEQI